MLRGYGGQHEASVPLGVTRELFAPLLKTTSHELFSGAAANVMTLLNPVVRPSWPPPEAADPDTTYAMAHSLYWFVAGLAESSPTVLIVDDVHWADDATQHWLAYLIRRVRELPVLVVLAVRPGLVGTSSALASALASADIQVLRPQSLTLEATACLVGSLLGPADDSFIATVHGATAGNPLLVTALATELAAEGRQPSADAVADVASVGADLVARIVLPRLRQLGDDAVTWARTAAVLGPTAGWHDVIATSGLSAGAGASASDALRRAGMIHGEKPTFAHPLVREAVIADLSAGERAQLHRRAADVLAARAADVTEVAHHLAASYPAADPRTVDTLHQAARISVERGSPETAVQLLQRCLDEPPPSDRRHELLLDLGLIGARAHVPDAVRWLGSAVDTAPDEDNRMRALLGLLNAASALGKVPPVELVRDLIPRVSSDLAFQAAAWLDLGGFFFLQPPDPTLATALPEASGATRGEQMWLVTRCIREVMSATPTAQIETTMEFLEHASTAAVDDLDSLVAPWRGFGWLALGDFRATTEYLSTLRERAVTRGARTVYEFASVGLGYVAMREGDVARAESDIVTAVEAHDEHGWVLGQTMRQAVEVATLRERDRAEVADDLLARAGLVHAPPPATAHGLMLLQERGLLRLRQLRHDLARADFELLGRWLTQAHGCDCPLFPWRSGRALALHGLGRRDEAIADADAQLARAVEFGEPTYLGVAARVAGEVRGRSSDARPLLVRAVEELAGTQARLEYGRALVALGRTDRINGRLVEAREPLRVALELAAALGAQALRSDARRELLETGVRPRRTAVTGLEALTAAERRVVELAATGRSNREIAQGLFVTAKTVEKHLGNAYAKLGIRSRKELPAVVR